MPKSDMAMSDAGAIAVFTKDHEVQKPVEVGEPAMSDTAMSDTGAIAVSTKDHEVQKLVEVGEPTMSDTAMSDAIAVPMNEEDVEDQVVEPPAAVMKKKPGRPKGSKNKTGAVIPRTTRKRGTKKSIVLLANQHILDEIARADEKKCKRGVIRKRQKAWRQ
jgi:hypothetical protein